MLHSEMTAVAWTVIGLLAAALLGRCSNLGGRIDGIAGRIDGAQAPYTET